MAVVDDFESNEPINFERSVKATEKTNFKTHDELGLSVINNKEKKLSDIIQYVGGFKWKGDYYNNLSTTNDSVSNHSTMLDKTIQKYNKIEGLVIFLDDTLSNTAKLEDIELEGKINAGIVPFIGDMFISNMLGGRNAIFTVNEINTLTYQLHKIYSVKLKFFQFLDNYTHEFKDLENKVVNTYYYDTRFIINYGSPILLKEDYKDKIDFEGYRLKLLDKYLDLFVDKETSMLNIFSSPFNVNGLRMSSSANYIDPYMSRFFRKTTNVEENYKLLHISYPIEDDTYDFNQDTILDLILNKGTFSDMMFVEKFLYWKPLEGSDSNPTLRHISYLGIDGIVNVVKQVDSSHISDTANEYLFTRIEGSDAMNKRYPLKPIKENKNCYIFSESFYNNDIDNMTDFEKIVHSYLNFGNIKFRDLKPYIDSFNYWNKYEQFYIIPIIMHFINVLMRETYSNR